MDFRLAVDGPVFNTDAEEQGGGDGVTCLVASYSLWLSTFVNQNGDDDKGSGLVANLSKVWGKEAANVIKVRKWLGVSVEDK